MIPETWARWPCPDCREPQTGRIEPDDRRCTTCRLAALDRRMAQVHPDAVRLRFRTMSPDQRARADRAEVLQAHRWPPRYRGPFDEPDPWPRHQTGVPDAWKHQIELDTWDGRLCTLLLLGDVGAGKTMLATELCWRLWQAGRSMIYMTTQTLIRALWHDSRLLRADVMLIDDIDRGISGDAWEALWAAVDQRYSAEQITVATANRGLDELYDRNSALADRFRPGLIVPMRGTTRRGQ